MGAYELHTNDLTMTVPPKIGGTAKFTLTGAPGLAAIFVGFNQAPVPVAVPFGVTLMDAYFLSLGTTASQATVSIPVANNASLEGARATLQAVFVGANKNLELLNVVEVFVAK